MGISQLELGRLFLYALLLGSVLGIVYDLLRLTRLFLGAHYSRRTAKRLRQMPLPLLPAQKDREESRALGIVLFLEDLLFCFGVGVALVLLLYELNNGKLRIPAILCCGAGFLIYRSTVGRLMMLVFEFVAFFLETAVRYAVFFVSWPILAIKKQLCRLFARLWQTARRKREKNKRVRYTTRQKKQIRSNCGIMPAFAGGSESKVIKKGKKYARNQKETVQPESASSRFFGSDRGRFHRGVRKQHDEI